MKLVYSRRALADLEAIAAYYAASASPAIAESIGRRLVDVIDRIGPCPGSGLACFTTLSRPSRRGCSLPIQDFLPGARRLD